MLKHTPLHDRHTAAGAKMMAFGGYDMPVRYAGDTEEHLAVRQRAGLFDVSHMGEFLIRGPQALPFLQYITSNDVAAIPPGKAQYNCLPNETGGVVDDLIIYRLEDELFLAVVNASNLEKDWAWFNQQNEKFGATLENISEDTALIALSGPAADAILSKLTDRSPAELPYYGHARYRFNGIDNVLIATTGYTGERTYEIFLRNEQAAAAWDALMDAGKEHGLQPAGLGARDTLRAEMGYMLYGNDLSDEISPLEAGLQWITKLNKGDFIGSDVLKKQKADGLTRRLVAFEMQDRGIPRGHMQVARPSDGAVVGFVSTGIYSPLLRKGVGLAFVPPDMTALGTELHILIRDKASPAKVVKAPFVQETSLSRRNAG